MRMPSSRRRTDRRTRDSRFASWRPFLTGVVLGLAFLIVLGSAMAQGIDHAPFDALRRANVKNGVVNYPLLKWFDEDFKGPSGSTQRYISRYVADPEVAKALAADGYKVEWIDYDWSLNGTPPKG